MMHSVNVFYSFDEDRLSEPNVFGIYKLDLAKLIESVFLEASSHREEGVNLAKILHDNVRSKEVGGSLLMELATRGLKVAMNDAQEALLNKLAKLAGETEEEE